jgi:hypothetical protein
MTGRADYSRLPVRGAESIRINNPLTNSGYDCGYAAVSVKPKAALNQHPVSSRSTPAGGAQTFWRSAASTCASSVREPRREFAIRQLPSARSSNSRALAMSVPGGTVRVA